jgi:hypothetical protein
MFEATQRPAGFQRLWRERGAVCVFEVHALAPPHASSDFASNRRPHDKTPDGYHKERVAE